MDANLVNTIF
ncbi:hypothetical protein PCHDS_000538700 [Plasmodium chabaudi adami]|uniref:Uncharacterized protein n=1 Tax=Plasmodium chabaudi adami TaxID=5826 RepID=A0A1C6WPY1_PLACE|nr:hypothetical protein PCHDS_000538700 [Plasmodium chabaudi adami]